MIKYIFIFLIAASSLKAQWMQSTGIPSNQMIYSFAQLNGKMYAGIGTSGLTTGALYYSTDNGVTWANSTLEWTGLSAVMSLAVRGNYIFAGTYEDDLFISSNNGLNWSHVVLNNSAGVFALGVSGNNVVAYTNGQGPGWVSTNNGANWSITGAGVLEVVNDFLSADGKFYAGTRKGLAVSTNDGLTWITAANNGTPIYPDGRKPMSGLLYRNGILFANVIDKICYSSDFGENWTQTNITLSNFSTSYSMVYYGGRIYAALYGLSDTSKGVITTSNNGSNWSFMTQGFGTTPSVRKLMLNNEYLLAGAYTGGIYRMPLSVLTGVSNENELTKVFSLKQNYPNPFNPVTKISFSINQKEVTSLKAFDSMGKVVSILVNEELQAGNYSFSFSGEKLSSGIYFYQLKAGNYFDTKKMMLVK
jgi:hypothetical protein